jgi:hypothetical protein
MTTDGHSSVRANNPEDAGQQGDWHGDQEVDGLQNRSRAWSAPTNVLTLMIAPCLEHDAEVGQTNGKRGRDAGRDRDLVKVLTLFVPNGGDASFRLETDAANDVPLYTLGTTHEPRAAVPGSSRARHECIHQLLLIRSEKLRL